MIYSSHVQYMSSIHVYRLCSLALKSLANFTQTLAYSILHHVFMDSSMDTKFASYTSTLQKQSAFHKDRGNICIAWHLQSFDWAKVFHLGLNGRSIPLGIWNRAFLNFYKCGYPSLFHPNLLSLLICVSFYHLPWRLRDVCLVSSISWNVYMEFDIANMNVI